MENNYELFHWGIKGQKWGVRRFQNKDGSLTPAGKKRVQKGGQRKSTKPKNDQHEDYKEAHTSRRMDQMSTQELKRRNSRLQAEQQYRELNKKASSGQKFITGFIATAATVTAVVTAYEQYRSFSTKYAKPVANKALDKIGDMIVKNIDLTKPLH